MRGRKSVVAVIDAADDQALVWWVNAGLKEQSFARLCGAWTVQDRAQLEPLVYDRIVLATASGQQALASAGVVPSRRLDLEATAAAVHAELARLRKLWESENATRTKSKNLAAPDFPAIPTAIDVESPPAWLANDPSEDHLDRVLRLSHWLVAVCDGWDSLEDVRLARPWMSKIDGATRRMPPVVTR